MLRSSKVALVASVTVVALGILVYINKRFALPSDKLEIYNRSANSEPELPPGEPPPLKFIAPHMSSTERHAFLSANYRIVRKVAELPAGIRKLYTAKGGSHVAIADPGERFEATDVITDPDLPRRRLIFAGVAQDRAFIHYEAGGIAHSYLVELFRLESPDIAVALWSGYGGPANSLEEMNELVLEPDRNSCGAESQFQSKSEVRWQDVNQLCGTLEFEAPKQKTITTAEGKRETRLYANVLENSDVKLFSGNASDESCCKGKMQLARTKSNRQGRFELLDFQRGWYWLHIESGNLTTTLPLHLTADFNDKSCHSPSIGRIFTIDAQPPKVETRIY